MTENEYITISSLEKIRCAEASLDGLMWPEEEKVIEILRTLAEWRSSLEEKAERLIDDEDAM